MGTTSESDDCIKKYLAKECIAVKIKCNKCRKMGHLAKAYKSKDDTNERNGVYNIDKN